MLCWQEMGVFFFPRWCLVRVKVKEYERESGGVAVHRGIRGQEGYTRDISISQQGWW